MTTRHQMAAEKMAKAAALRKVIEKIPSIADRITPDKVRRENTCFTLYRVAYKLRKVEVGHRVVKAEHDALADLTEVLEALVDNLVMEAAKDLATVAKEDLRWKADSRTRQEN